MAETPWYKLPELAASELVSEGPARINSALSKLDETNLGQQDYLQPGVVAANDWLFTAAILETTGELSTSYTGGGAWLPASAENSRLVRTVTTAAVYEKLKPPALPVSGKYMTIGFELAPGSSWNSAASLSLISGTEYATQAEAEGHSPAVSAGKIRLRDVVVQHTANGYVIAKQLDRRPYAAPYTRQETGRQSLLSWAMVVGSEVVVGTEDFTLSHITPAEEYLLVWDKERGTGSYFFLAVPDTLGTGGSASHMRIATINAKEVRWEWWLYNGSSRVVIENFMLLAFAPISA